MIRIAMVDDELLILQLLQKFFESQDIIEVKWISDNGQSFLDKLEIFKSELDVIIVDMRLKAMDGLEVVKIVKERFPEIKIIVLSSYYKDTHLGYMMKSGVNAYVPKGIQPELLMDVIVSVNDRGYFFIPGQVEVMRNQIASNVPVPRDHIEDQISQREKEVLEQICMQKTAQEIADQLFIAKRTVEGHRNNLLLKTGVKNTAGLVIYAVQNNIVDIKQLMPRHS